MQLDSGKVNQFIADIKNTVVDYGYAEMINYEKAMAGIVINHTVSKPEVVVSMQYPCVNPNYKKMVIGFTGYNGNFFWLIYYNE